MAFADVKRIHAEMGLRQPLSDAVKALDKTLRDLDEYETELTNISGVEGVTKCKFQTDFPSFCFHIATGVGKTRLLGACIAYLYRTKGWTDFFVLVPGSTIYNKFKSSDFVSGGKKFIFAGLEDFPDFNLITAENYRQVVQTGLFDAPINIYLFNIGKIFEPRKDKVFKFSREDADGLGLDYKEGFASYLAERRPVVLMDEAHRYYAPASLNAMNRLKPRLGLEFTATPTFSGNIISRFNLGQAIDAGYVKRPRVARVVNDNTPENQKEQTTLLDAVRNHERKKGVLAAYCTNNGLPLVTPILLVTTEDTDHGDRVAAYLSGETEITVKASDGTEKQERLYDGNRFGAETPLEGRYKGKVLLVHSKTEEDTDAAVRNLETNHYEIVVHVNKLKEGLDVNNIYTLGVLRASKAAVLTEQIIGRGLRLPFGEPIPDGADLDENVADLNALDIMPHKEYQKVIDEADDYLKGRIAERKIDRAVKSDAPTQELVTVSPSPNEHLQFEVPIIETELTQTERRLQVFAIQPGLAITSDEDYQRKVELTDLQAQKPTLIEAYGVNIAIDPVKEIVRAVLEQCPETDADDATTLAALARAYLTALRPDESTWRYAFALRKKPIIDDFIGQIRQELDKLHPVAQVKRTGLIPFTAWNKNVPLAYVVPERKDNDPAQEVKGVLIGGYQKSLYPMNHFDSKQEKWLADCLERDTVVEKWVRLPIRQLRIGLSRSGYNPDFIAVANLPTGERRHYLLEVKAANKCDPMTPDPDVLRKYFAAEEWVNMANQEKTQGMWKYCLLTDKEIEARRNGDFLYLVDGARKFV